jgi:hypothetical protein
MEKRLLKDRARLDRRKSPEVTRGAARRTLRSSAPSEQTTRGSCFSRTITWDSRRSHDLGTRGDMPPCSNRGPETEYGFGTADRPCRGGTDKCCG